MNKDPEKASSGTLQLLHNIVRKKHSDICKRITKQKYRKVFVGVRTLLINIVSDSFSGLDWKRNLTYITAICPFEN